MAIAFLPSNTKILVEVVRMCLYLSAEYAHFQSLWVLLWSSAWMGRDACLTPRGSLVLTVPKNGLRPVGESCYLGLCSIGALIFKMTIFPLFVQLNVAQNFEIK